MGSVPVLERLTATGYSPGRPLALSAAPAIGVALAWAGGSLALPGATAAEVVRAIEPARARWVWWEARGQGAELVTAGIRVRACWDLAAVSRLIFGTTRNDPGAVWAAAAGLLAPAPAQPVADLLDADDDDPDPVRTDGQLSTRWQRGAWAESVEALVRWAEVMAELQTRQAATIGGLADPRSDPRGPALRLLTAYSESAAALLAVELEHDGLPVDREVASALLTPAIGPSPRSQQEEAAERGRRDAAVLQEFPGHPVDLRNPAQVRELLSRVGLEVPDTRSWRLEPHATTIPAVAALLRWRKAERLATTYGWRWLENSVGADARLRGQWGASDAAAGRMTASSGLHNLPTELRAAVRAEPGRVLVRADLGQIEPRVLAAVSGDPALAKATLADDLYTPVADALGCDRPTAKVAVLAAMYGQTTGTAGRALKDMERAYPRALAYLRDAEEEGRAGRALRTYGGRLLPTENALPAQGSPGADFVPSGSGNGRFARNAVVQGAAAELFKAWAATVRSGMDQLDGQIVLCLHDELLLHVPVPATQATSTWLAAALDATSSWWAAGSGVRFVVDVSSGPVWQKG